MPPLTPTHFRHTGWAWVVVVLVGLLVAAAVFIFLGFKWRVTWGADDWGCGTAFNPADYDTPDQCSGARTTRLIFEIVVALFCGFVAAAVTAHVLTKSETEERAVTGTGWYG
jgi:hypothetical protein